MDFLKGEKGEQNMWAIIGGLFFLTSIIVVIWAGHSISHKKDVVVVHTEEPQFEVKEYKITETEIVSIVEESDPVSEVEEEVEEIFEEELIEEPEIEVEITEIPSTEFPESPYKEAYVSNSKIALDSDLQLFTQAKCEEYEVSYPFVLALMETESSFNRDIGNEKILGGEEGKARYYGYMQLSAGNCNKAKNYGLDAHTPEGNIEMAIILLSGYVKKYDDIEGVVTAYKSGEGAADSGKRLKCKHLIERMNYFSEIVN